MKISDQEAYKKKMEFLLNAPWAAPDAFAGAADAFAGAADAMHAFAGAADGISKEMAKPIRRWAITVFVLWIIGGLLSLALSIGTLALTVWAVVKVLQATGVL